MSYDDSLKVIFLTSDEIDLLIPLLQRRMDTCSSLGEEITVRDLLDKLI